MSCLAPSICPHITMWPEMIVVFTVDSFTGRDCECFKWSSDAVYVSLKKKRTADVIVRCKNKHGNNVNLKVRASVALLLCSSTCISLSSVYL